MKETTIKIADRLVTKIIDNLYQTQLAVACGRAKKNLTNDFITTHIAEWMDVKSLLDVAIIDVLGASADWPSDINQVFFAHVNDRFFERLDEITVSGTDSRSQK